jgi:hypothetical protein
VRRCFGSATAKILPHPVRHRQYSADYPPCVPLLPLETTNGYQRN